MSTKIRNIKVHIDVKRGVVGQILEPRAPTPDPPGYVSYPHRKKTAKEPQDIAVMHGNIFVPDRQEPDDEEDNDYDDW